MRHIPAWRVGSRKYELSDQSHSIRLGFRNFLVVLLSSEFFFIPMGNLIGNVRNINSADKHMVLFLEEITRDQSGNWLNTSGRRLGAGTGPEGARGCRQRRQTPGICMAPKQAASGKKPEGKLRKTERESCRKPEANRKGLGGFLMTHRSGCSYR